MMDMGTKFGLTRRGTILKYNEDGTVLVGIDEVGLQQAPQTYTVPMPMAWAGPNGEFIGGFPVRGSSVTMRQAQGGQWFVDSFIPSRSVFTTKNLMNSFRPGRALMQVQGGTRLFVDPNLGIQSGDSETFLHIDPNKDIISHNFKMDMSFTEASRSIDGVVKRDLIENSTRNILGSSLDSHIYDESLYTVGLDPTTSTAIRSSGDRVRNPPFVEKREIIYEFAQSYNVLSDAIESLCTSNKASFTSPIDNGRKDSRADTMSLSLGFPNHLIETIKGTVVDTFGNILDINRFALPIGKIDNLSLRKNSDKSDAVARIKAQARRGIAYHMEINTKKPSLIDSTTGADQITPIPDTDSSLDYSRNRSRFFIDIDKEGQFKINVPSSSETGNIPLLTRYENYSSLIAKKDGTDDPNAIARNTNLQDIFLDNFAGKPSIKLKSNDKDLDGYASPVDRFTDKPLMLGTAFHDITKALSTFLPNGGPLVAYDTDNTLNQLKSYDNIVSDTVIVSGVDANGGGRSGMINFDGFVSFNFGANTVDRQSAWFDYAGGVISQFGRDKRGISYAANLDGHAIVQIGGPGIGNSYDSRFAKENDAARAGVLDVRVVKGDGLMTIVRIDQFGVKISTQGRLDIEAEQSINIKSRADLHLNAENIYMYSDSPNPRTVLRKKVSI